jgi:hypothetical protein
MEIWLSVRVFRTVDIVGSATSILILRNSIAGYIIFRQRRTTSFLDVICMLGHMPEADQYIS